VCLPQYNKSIANPSAPANIRLHYIFQHHIAVLMRVRA
jgi:hypothetical protein